MKTTQLIIYAGLAVVTCVATAKAVASTLPAIAAGAEDTIVLKADGTVWGFGRNQAGQLGDGSVTERHSPVQAKGLADCVAVQTDSIQKGALASNGLPIAWLLANFGTTNIDAIADPDHDGMSNLQEYLAGTNPNDSSDYLHVTSIARDNPPSTYTTLWWASKPTRFYAIQQTPALGGSPFADRFVLPFAGTNNAGFDDTQTNSFYRVRAFRPLTP